MINPRTFGIFCCVVLAIMLSARYASTQRAWSWCGGPEKYPWVMEVEMSGSWEDWAIDEIQRWDTYADVFTWRYGDGYDGWNRFLRPDYNEMVFMTDDQTRHYFDYHWGRNVIGAAFSRGSIWSWISTGFDSNSRCFRFLETDIVFNLDRVNLDRDRDRQWSEISFRATALHELGHALGRPHAFHSLSTMNYIPDDAQRYLTLADALALRNQMVSFGEEHRIRNVTDLATYPFRHNGGYKGQGITTAGTDKRRVQAGGTFRLQNTTIENIGTRTLSDVRINIYLSTNAIISISDYHVGELEWSSFPTTTWWEGSIPLAVPNYVPPGQYYIGAIIFYNTDQTDSISYNNEWVLPSSKRIRVDSGDGGGEQPSPADYCRAFGPCPAGRGDCDSNSECQDGLTCVNDVGARYGLPAHYDVCEAGDPDYCVSNSCGIGDGDCDPGQCDEGVCVNDVGARYGLPAHYDVCEAGDPDYCVSNSCGIGDGDCDPGQCDEGVCVNDVGARYGLPAHYDVCEAGDPDYCVSNSCGIGDGDCDPGQCDEGVCVNDVGARYGLPAHYDVCEAGDPDYCVSNSCGIGDGDCDPGQCDEGVCVNDVGARYGLPAHYDVCEAGGGG